MKQHLSSRRLQAARFILSALFCVAAQLSSEANPTGGTVAQGSASISTIGSQVNINQTSANAFINWQSFNLSPGETTTFNQPSASSVTWNYINDPSASSINGNINANGYVVLQNPNGFSIGGSAVINAHGLVMTTASTPALDLSGGGAWSFNSPPPTAKIVNYGQINITGGGSGFLIASDIENNGTISAPGGKIGLYAGQKVLVSMSPDGRGLSAQVTLPQGSVDNNGQLIADAGSIAAQAQFVNQDGLIQANSVQKINGVIELVASDKLNLGASSDLKANGDSTSASASQGGFVVLNAGSQTFADQAGSKISALGANAGQNGIVEIFGNGVTAGGLLSTYGSLYALLINPFNMTLSTGTTTTGSNPTLNLTALSKYSQIDLQALNNITLNSAWTLAQAASAATVSLTAGNNITLNNSLDAGVNWNVNMTAGASYTGTTATSGNNGIYLKGASYIQTRNGDINLWAPSEVLVATGSSVGNNGIRTLQGGNINVTALYGNVNTGSNPQGFYYVQNDPNYYILPTVGGISTVAGGNVNIYAGGNVNSYLPSGSTTTAAYDGGTGAFGSQPGNVTITAGGSVYGHYVLANGTGTITAGQNVGATSGANSFALSLIKGDWNVIAPNGNIYVQEVRNPNGVFNNTFNNRSDAAHLFDYDSLASVSLDAGLGVYLTDVNIPRLSGNLVPVLYPPIMDITAGSGGVTLQGNVTLFPSVNQSLTITTTAGGNFVSAPNNPGTTPELLMSDSAQTKWVGGTGVFTDTDLGKDNAVEPVDAPNPVVVDIAGDMKNITLITTKQTELTVGGAMINCGFSGQNLNAGDVTTINVAGQIYNRSPYSFVYDVTIPGIPAANLLPGMASSWDSIFTLALNPAVIAALPPPPKELLPAQYAAYAIQNAALFSIKVLANGKLQGSNPGFVYNASTGRLGFAGTMSPSVASALTTQTITVLHLVNGLPVLDSTGHFQTDTISWVNPSLIQNLYAASTSDGGAPSPINGQLGYRLGGPGMFDFNAGSISLGNTYGILSCGVADPQGGFGRYGNLAPETPSGATLDVTVEGELSMLTSTIAAIGGGDVNLTSLAGSMDLGSQELFSIPRQIGLGVFTSGVGDVNVTAFGDINVNGSRIAAFNGGDIKILSTDGNVNAGAGGDTFNSVGVSYVDPITGTAQFYTEGVFGSGILAYTLDDPSKVPGSPLIPGDITITTPRGDINASLGGIVQEAQNGNVAAGPSITLTAGSDGHVGNINLGNSGVIGGSVNVTANGDVTGLIISRQDSQINAAQSFSGTVLAAGTASLNAGGTVSGTIVGVGGVNANGAGGVTAALLGQNVSANGGAAQSTLGTSATATSTGQNAASTASNDAKQEISATNTQDDDQKKKKPQIRKVSRVTVILSSAVPPQ